MLFCNHFNYLHTKIKSTRNSKYVKICLLCKIVNKINDNPSTITRFLLFYSFKLTSKKYYNIYFISSSRFFSNFFYQNSIPPYWKRHIIITVMSLIDRYNFDIREYNKYLVYVSSHPKLIINIHTLS